MTDTQISTSDDGVKMLEAEEAVVLRAYRDPVGIWTIGAGLTAASGVVVPKAGMVITREEASRLLDRALEVNYEPAVRAAMPAAKQHEFDAGILFHWNTGAIGRASWVKHWKEKAAATIIRAALKLWNKGDGKVLPGLVARREREADLLMFGLYVKPAPLKLSSDLAMWAVALSGSETASVVEGFRQLGYDPGFGQRSILIDAVRKFQADHGLTVDGIIGRATLSALQRRLDAATKTKTAAVASAPAAAPAVVDVPAGLDWVGPVLWAGLAIYAASLAWRYRDAVAAKVNPFLPRVSAFLRSY